MIEVVVGLIIGLVLGLTGAGGSIFAVPLLLLATPMSPSDAMGMALGAVAVTALYATASQSINRKNSGILWTPAIILAASGALTAPLGKWASTLFTPHVLLAGFTCVAVLIAVRMWIQANRRPEETTSVRANDGDNDLTTPATMACKLSPTGQFLLRPKCISGLGVGGLVIGFASGLFGVGGGFLIIPLLLFLSQIAMRNAVATSLAIIAAVSSSGFASHLVLEYSNNQTFDWLTFIKLSGASLTAMFISQRISRAIAGPLLQKIFSVALVLVSVISILK